MALAKHHEEIAEKILANLDSLKTDSSLQKFLNEINKNRSSRLESYGKSRQGASTQSSDGTAVADFDVATIFVIKKLYKENVALRNENTILQQQVNKLEARLIKSRETMKKAYLTEISRLKNVVKSLRGNLRVRSANNQSKIANSG